MAAVTIQRLEMAVPPHRNASPPDEIRNMTNHGVAVRSAVLPFTMRDDGALAADWVLGRDRCRNC